MDLLVVAIGKSTLVRAMTGVATQKFKSEKERNITINIGMPDVKYIVEN